MAWYEIPGVSCIFALDYNSKLEENGSKVFLSNKPSEYLTTAKNKSSLFKTIVPGYGMKDFNFILKEKFYYKCLVIDKKNLVFNETKTYPEKELTFILKVKLKSSSKFLAETETSQTYYGLSFTSNLNDKTYDYMWRLPSFEETTGALGEEPISFNLEKRTIPYNLGIETVVLRVSREAPLKGELQTDYGTFSIPAATILSSNFFWNSRTFKIIGSSGSSGTWEPDGSIVAYGMFDKYLTDEEVSKCLSDIDSEFLVDKVLNDKEVYENSPKIKLVIPPYNCPKPTVLQGCLVTYKPRAEQLITKLNIKSYLENVKNSKQNKVFYKEFSGIDIEDIVTEEDTPVSTKLYLYEKESGTLLATTISTEEGLFAFRNLDKSIEYVITSHDKNYQFNSIIKNYLI